MHSRNMWRFVFAFLLLNAVFLSIGSLYERPLRVTGWWVGWVVVDLAALIGFGAYEYRRRGNHITIAKVFVFIVVTANVGAAVFLFVITPIQAWQCGKTGRDACGFFSLTYVIGLPAWILVDLLLGGVWLVGRGIAHGHGRSHVSQRAGGSA
jgi:hypothetical protein